jgi:hypothetical protein
MTGSVDIFGDESVAGDFVRIEYTDRPTCAALAAEGSAPTEPGTEGTFNIPGPTIGTPLEPSGDLYASTLRILPAVFSGPGTYVNDGEVLEIAGQITVEEFPMGPTYFIDRGNATVTILEDGSGSIEFTDVVDDLDENAISGTVAWACADPTADEVQPP